MRISVLFFALTACQGFDAPPELVAGTAADKALTQEDGTGSDEQFAHQVVIYDPARTFECAGSVVDATWVLTTADCVAGWRPTDLRVRRPMSGAEAVEVKAVEVHPDHIREGVRNDLALIQLVRPLEGATPVLLPSADFERDELTDDARLWLSGNAGNRVSFGDTRLMATCGSHEDVARPEHVCTNGFFFTGACETRDHGVPLLVAHGNQWVQLGLAASLHCGLTDRANLFTRTAYHQDWIRSVATGARVVDETGPRPTGDDHGDTIADATPMGSDSSLDGQLEAGDVDVFAIEVPAPGLLVVVSDSAVDPKAQLLDATGNRIVANDDHQGLDFRIEAEVDAGTHYVLVSGYGDSQAGAYTVHSAFDANDPVTEPVFADAIPASFPGELEVEVPVGDVVTYVFEPTSFEASFRTVGALDTMLWVYDADGNELAFNDDVSSADTDASTPDVPSDGVLYVTVGGYNGAGGSTTLVAE